MRSISVSDVIDCSMQCLMDTRCKSCNYKYKSSPYTCELNNDTKTYHSAAEFPANQDFNYYVSVDRPRAPFHFYFTKVFSLRSLVSQGEGRGRGKEKRRREEGKKRGGEG